MLKMVAMDTTGGKKDSFRVAMRELRQQYYEKTSFFLTTSSEKFTKIMFSLIGG